MAVTSDQILTFIEKAVTVEHTLDQDGQVLFQTEPRLDGESLATALRVVADLAAHETGIGFAQQQFEATHPQVGGNLVPFPGPRAN